MLVIVILAVALLFLLLYWARRRGQRESQKVQPSPARWVPGPIPPNPPVGYTEGISVAPEEWDESADPTTAYGTYTMDPTEHSKFAETIRGQEMALTGKAGATLAEPPELDAYTPFSMKITPDGIQMETIPKAGETPNVVNAEFATIPEYSSSTPQKPAGPSSEDAYGVMQSLARKPRSLDGIKQEVRLEDDALFAVLGALSKAKLIAQGTRKDGGATIFVLTPLGRKLARRFIQSQGGKKEQEAVGTKGQAALPTGKDAAKGKTVRLEKGATLQDIHTIGEERKTLEEETPFKTLRPEDVNPQLKGKKSLSKEVLQPMEMRVQSDRGTDARDTSATSDAEKRAQILMERAKKERKEKGKFGVEQTARREGEDRE
jgi:hypothetical protein